MYRIQVFGFQNPVITRIDIIIQKLVTEEFTQLQYGFPVFGGKDNDLLSGNLFQFIPNLRKRRVQGEPALPVFMDKLISGGKKRPGSFDKWGFGAFS